ncbi:MAG: outer membrane beta-barrel protein [Chlorobi bacterium]|nr:outer membrane beta-barrel protein [Chlorobiota bacterium]
MLRCFLLFTIALVTAVYADEDVLRPRGRVSGQTSIPQPEGLVHNPWALGIELGGSLSFYAQDITLHQLPDYETNITSGSGLGPLINLALDYALNDDMGVQARLGYDKKHYTLSGYLDAPCETPPRSGFYLPARLNQDYSQTINYWTGGLAFRYRFAENWLVIGGLTYHSLSNASYTETDTILTPTCQFYDQGGNPIGQRQQISHSNTADFTAARWSIDIGIGYRVPLSKNVVLLPRLNGQLFLTEVAPNNSASGFHQALGQIYSYTNRRLHALQLVVGIWFNL